MVIPVDAEGEVQLLHVMVTRAHGAISNQRSLPVRFMPVTRYIQIGAGRARKRSVNS
ncbi:MAG: hypothetical protein D4R74_00955 [Betaproteobacteria bacterium]|nr:MAG: hypothetical protein D4R74_00955 [Betaproteobacteria bacterium]